jgi:hypothetical protein
MSTLRSIVLLAMLAGCGPEPVTDLAGCPDAACRQQRLLEDFDADPEATVAMLGELEPVEQEALVRSLAVARPDALEGSCAAAAPRSPTWSICGRLKERPHLIRGKKRAEPEATRPRLAPGPDSQHPPVPALAGAEDLPAAQDCARRFAALPKGRDECVFQAAEALARAQGWRATPEVLTLCVGAGDFVHGCLHHSLATLMPPVPAADRAAPEDLTEALAALEALRSVVGPELADAYESFFWGLWTTHAFRHASHVDGRLLQVLPPEAQPHVRVAAAYRLLQLHGVESQPALEAWVEELGAALADAGSASPGSRHEVTLWKARDFWPDDMRKAGEHEIPAVFCMGPGRRALADDAGEDLRIALLEASARLEQPPAAAFYAQVLDGQSSLTLRWTALRLLGALYPEALTSLDLSGAPELLRARADKPVRDR